MATRIVEIISDSNFQEEIDKTPSNQLIVIDFFATWCGPCRFIAPKLAELSLKYASVKFIKVDVDSCQVTAASNGVQAMPTFLFFKNKQKLDTLRGADPHKLEQVIIQWMGTYSLLDKDPVRVVAGRSFACFKEILRNDRLTFVETAKLIVRYADNIIKDPDNLKYRQIKLGNALFMNKLLPVEGAVNCLFSMGFEEMDDKLLLSPSRCMDNLHALRDALVDELDRKQNNSGTPPKASCSGTTTGGEPNSSHLQAIQGKRTLAYTPQTTTNEERIFFETLKSKTNLLLLYEDEQLQEQARSHIPLQSLKEQASKDSEKTRNEDGVAAVSPNDCFLLLLLEWFKNKFFTWTDSPKCPSCSGSTTPAGTVEATQEERQWGAGVVETYKCQVCATMVRFPRYNHPQKLLETRTGRCGEWANCFTLCCRASGLEARMALDWTDHVWTEVYSESQKRWLHCDACENTCDKPLTYEAGWGKKLTYVVAFAKDEVLDVTWRYSIKYLEVKNRRRLVSENWLTEVCDKITVELRQGCTEERRKEYMDRHIKEIVEFVTPRSVNKGELDGRLSGSLAWRKLRGEEGAQANKESTGYAFTLNEEHEKAGRIRVRYIPVKDCYYVALADDVSAIEPVVRGWQNGTHSCEHVRRKVEQDWKMVYLARTEGSKKAIVSWLINIEDSMYCFDHVTLHCTMKTFENATCSVRVNDTDVSNSGTDEVFVCDGQQFSGCQTLRIDVTLSGGNGDNAWQHSQLFRCEESNMYVCGLDIDITLKKRQI